VFAEMAAKLCRTYGAGAAAWITKRAGKTPALLKTERLRMMSTDPDGFYVF
jgi:hypothetical protein